jgi:hypothetical protein
MKLTRFLFLLLFLFTQLHAGVPEPTLANSADVALAEANAAADATAKADAAEAAAIAEAAAQIAAQTATVAVASAEIDWAAGSVFTKTLSGNTTLTFANIDSGKTITFLVTGAGGYGINWPAEVSWVKGSAPTNPATAATLKVEFTATSGSTVIGHELSHADEIEAIATAKAAAYPIVTNPEAIHHFYDQLIDLANTAYPADGKYVVMGFGGDSMGTSSGFAPDVVEETIRRFGQGAIATNSFSSGAGYGSGQLSTTVTLGGSAALTSDTYTYLPNGEFYTIPSGSTVTEIPFSPHIHSGYRKVRCWYGIRTGGGTLTFTITQAGTTLTAKNVDTSVGTNGTIGYVDFDSADGLVLNGKPSLVVSNATATSHYLGTYYYLGAGFVPATVGRGGSSYASALTGAAANLATFCEAMDVRLIFHAVKEEDTDLSDLDTMMTRWYAQHPRCSHVWVGNTSSPSGDGGLDVTTNAAIRAKCQTYQWAFVDGQKLLRSVAYMDGIGSTADGWNESSVAPHLSPVANKFLGTWVIQNVLMNFNVAGGRFSMQTLNGTANSLLSDTRLRATIWAQTSSSIGATNFTQTTNPDMGKMTFNFTASPAPVASTGRAGKFMSHAPALNSHRLYKYTIFDGQLIDGIEAVVMVGGASQSEAVGMTNTGFNGFRIIHGTTAISGVQIPFIRFAVKGSGTSETISPKIYHSASTGVAPWAGGTWISGTDNTYWVEYIGSGSSTTKRFRAWHQSMASSGSETTLTARRLIADWSGTITVGGTSDASTYFGLVTDSSPTTPGGARSAGLIDFQVEMARKNVLTAGWQDMNN